MGLNNMKRIGEGEGWGGVMVIELSHILGVLDSSNVFLCLIPCYNT